MTVQELYEETKWLMAEGYAGEEIWVEDPNDFNNPRKAESIRQVGERIYIDQEEGIE